MTATLLLTNGTDTVNLLDGPFRVRDWQPASPQLKGGGGVATSPFVDGSVPTTEVYDWAVEAFDLTVSGRNQDGIASALQTLRRLLRSATEYFTSRRVTTPVWIECKASRETNVRYAVVYGWANPGDASSPFMTPFYNYGASSIDGFQLAIKRGHWRDEKPTTNHAITIYQQISYDGRQLGEWTGTTATAQLFVGNHSKTANLTHIYYYDASMTAWSTNIMDAALPAALFPVNPAVGDILYFGSDTSAGVTYPMFNSIIMNIGVTNTNFDTIVWEYWNGAAWTDATSSVYDGTTRFTVSGGNPILFPTESHVAVAVNGVTAFWWRMRITHVTGGAAAPTQTTRPPFVPSRPDCQIFADQISGDLPALSRIYYRAYNSTLRYTNRLVVALRDATRGADFSPFINLSNVQNQTGVTVAVSAVPEISITTYIYSPTGKAVCFNPSTADTEIITITVSGSVASQYIGVYHAYVRARQSSGFNGDFSISMLAQPGTPSGMRYLETGYVPVVYDGTPGGGALQIVDMGIVTLDPPILAGEDMEDGISIELSLKNTSTSSPGDLYVADLVLIPIDEWAGDYRYGDFSSNSGLGGLGGMGTYYLDIDSINYPRATTRALQRVSADDDIDIPFRVIQNGPSILSSDQRPGQHQKIYFLAMYAEVLTESYTSDPFRVASIQLFAANQYYTMRGNE